MPAQPSGHILELLAPRSRSNLLFLSPASEPSLARWGTDEVLQNLSGTGETDPIWSLGTATVNTFYAGAPCADGMPGESWVEARQACI